MPKRSFDDPLYNGTPYSLDDVDEIEAARGKPYPRLRKTVELVERLRNEIANRDYKRGDMFIAAALTGLIAREGAGDHEELADCAINIGNVMHARISDNEDLEDIDDPEET